MYKFKQGGFKFLLGTHSNCVTLVEASKYTFQQFWLYYSISKSKKHSFTGDNMYSHLTYLEVRINGVKEPQSSSKPGVTSKNLGYGRIHRKAAPSLLHFLFIIGPLGSEIR